MKLKGFSSTIILFILLTQSMCYSQNNCDCAEFEKAEKKSNNEELMNSLVKSSNAFCVAKSHEMLAEFFVDEGEFDSAAFYLKKAETIYKSNGCGLGAFQNNYKYWAGLNYNKGDFSKSLDFSLKYLKCAEENKNTYEICNAYTMIAQLFNQIEQTNNGIPYLQKAIPLIENMEMSNKKADLFLKLARRFMWNYQDTKNTNRLDSSKLFAQKTLDIARILKRDRAMAGAFNVLQGCEYEKGNYKQALILLDSSAKYTDMSNDADRALYLQDKADILMELGDYTSALSLTDTVISIYKKSDNASFTATAYDLKYSILKRSGNMAEALKYLEMTRKLEDSLVNIESKEKINELEQKYKKTQNEQTIKELYQASEISSLRNRILLVLVLVALLIIIIIVFINRQRRLKNKQEAMEIEQRLNRARMNPHFFFNTLTSLQSFSELENEDSKVSRYLSKYAKIMRQTLESTYNEMNNLDEEVDYLSNYLDIQKMRYPNRFNYSIDIDEAIDTFETYIPSMIIQPFIENSIEHGFEMSTKEGNINIHFSKQATELIIILTDNGRGLNADKKEKKYPSRATQIIKDRLLILNKHYKSNSDFEIKSGENGSGTVVKIRLPFLSNISH